MVMIKPNFYIVCVSGWEEYTPLYFTATETASQESFSNIVQKCFENIWQNLKKANYDEYIEARYFLNRIPNELINYGYIQIEPQQAIKLGGSCYYGHSKTDRQQKPDIIPQHIWDEMVEHNLELNRKSFDEKGLEVYES